MCFKKKFAETKETELLKFVNSQLSDKEQHICFNFGGYKNDFKFCGFYAGYYIERQDFDFAETQINRALTLLIESLILIKDKFKSFGIDNKVVLTKIKAVLKLEEDFQFQMKEEHVKVINNNNNIRMGTIMLFEELSRQYMTFVINTKELLLGYIKKNFVDFDILNTISKTLKEQPTFLPNELNDYKYNLNGYSIVYNLENFLRVLIIIVLKGQSSKEMMYEDLYKYLKDQKAKEESNKWCDERYGGDLFYLNFTDLIKIIEYKKSDFEKQGIRIEKINSEIEKVGTIRNKIAHNNVITEDDLKILQTNSNMIYKFFKNFQEDVKNYKFNLKRKK